MTCLHATWRALAAPRRALPIALVAVPLIAAQWHFSRHHLGATAIAVVMVALFVAIAPAAWRTLMPADTSPASRPGRLLAYAVIGAVPALAGELGPLWLGAPDAFLTRGVNTAVVATLFWVGGWGLARDIDQEEGLDTARAHADALREALDRARLLAVRSHLDPHFLFNTLNAIAAWVHEDPDVAERMILDLSRLLREVLGGIGESAWPLRRELDLVRDVWALHRQRDPDAFEVSWEVDDAVLDVPVPPLLLLPLAENAVTHGPATGHRGVVGLSARAVGDRLHLVVSNPGPFGAPRDGGTGLSMLRQRVALSWPGTATLSVPAAGSPAAVTLDLPRAGPTGGPA